MVTNLIKLVPPREKSLFIAIEELKQWLKENIGNNMIKHISQKFRSILKSSVNMHLDQVQYKNLNG